MWFDQKSLYLNWRNLGLECWFYSKCLSFLPLSRSFISSFVFEAEKAVSVFLTVCSLKALNPHNIQGSTVLCFMLFQELEWSLNMKIRSQLFPIETSNGFSSHLEFKHLTIPYMILQELALPSFLCFLFLAVTARSPSLCAQNMLGLLWI